MDKDNMLQNIRRKQHVRNNGLVLRTINILRHRFIATQDVFDAIGDMERSDLLDSVNYLQLAGYIILRNARSCQETSIYDARDPMDTEAALSAAGIRLLNGKIVDDGVEV